MEKWLRHLVGEQTDLARATILEYFRGLRDRSRSGGLQSQHWRAQGARVTPEVLFAGLVRMAYGGNLPAVITDWGLRDQEWVVVEHRLQGVFEYVAANFRVETFWITNALAEVFR